MSRPAMLFDMDGTLLDSGGAVLATIAGIATAALGRRIRVGDLPPGAARTPRVAVLAALGVPDPDRLCQLWWDAAIATAPAPTMFDGAAAGLAAIKAAGLPAGLVTLQDRHRLPWMLPAEVLELLDVTVCRGDAKPKPSPEPVQLALHRLGRTPGEAVFVGDHVDDMLAAGAAGVTAIGVSWGTATPAELVAAGAVLVLDDPRQIGPGLAGHAAAPRRRATRTSQ